MNNQTAIVIGATGATGSHLVNLLLNDEHYSSVVVFSRRTLSISSPKLTEHLVNFDKLDKWQHKLKGDVLFSAMGSTLKLAGSKDAQYKVDVHYQYGVAAAARAMGVSRLVLISSPNANSKSTNFYLKMKGELEDKVMALGFEQCILIKPSIIESPRPEGRPGESVGAAVLSGLVKFIPLLRPYRPISARDLAIACINIADAKNGDANSSIIKVELGDLFNYL